ncbi:hypothetical protein BKA62DRAFT_685684 [Auriculariales sp. MPI-PUGE-AT-0066]|nr:hypothetical protein BKA62DRAFT_685684 [Auriculariales sp. MPI-PUGE-AT-0066]
MMQVEEAAVVAQEYISSLENLPQEVSFLLAEIRDRENRLQELQRELQRKTQNYVRSTLTGATAPGKDAEKAARNVDEWLQIETLADEKVQFANRLVELLSKACSRLDVDLNRIIGSGQMDQVLGGVSDVTNSLLFGGRSGFDKMQDNLRAAIGTPDGSPPNMSQMMEPPHKRRRLGNGMPSNRPSPAPAPSLAGRQRTRPNRSQAMDEDGDEPMDGDNDDDTIYCTCRKPSYDEMIACDAPGCPIEWFHVTCVGMVGQNPEHWYCPDCAPKMEGEMKRKRRK